MMRIRLREANELVSKVIEGGIGKDFSSLAERLPTLLMNNGLLLTVAYLQKRAKEDENNPEWRILEFIKEWLKKMGFIEKYSEERDLLQVLLDKDISELNLIFTETLRIAEALKIVSDARLGGSGSHES